MTQTLPLPAGPVPGPASREQMNIVVIGHVDHGKSTLVGRLLADTGSLPQGKLDQVREQCRRTAKPFEYAFLLDALKDEQSQGITIDSARCFFHTAKREYIIIDAPGHIEFLKNMISGAARAEAGLLLIDAHEGIRENSRRHGYLMSLLGIRQLAICVNKMDLIGYDAAKFEAIKEEYTAFLQRVGLQPCAWIPLSAREGDNLAVRSERTPWYRDRTVLQVLDDFAKEPPPIAKPFRFPVQDIYKFTALGDDRRIIAGRIETGTIAVGAEVEFVPSGKRSRIASIEGFNQPAVTEIGAGHAPGFTLTEQVYIRPGEIMCRTDQPKALASTRLRVNLFWLGRQPMIRNKRYLLKLGTARVPVWLTEIHQVMDASALSTDANRQQIERHDVAECTLETLKPIACDAAVDLPTTGRFVIVDHYEIAAGGIIIEQLGEDHRMIEEHVRRREQAWERSAITPAIRADHYRQRSALVLVCGAAEEPKEALARQLEEHLFAQDRHVYYLGVSNRLLGIDADLVDSQERDEYLRRLGEVGHLFTDAGLILIATGSDLDDHELAMIETLNRPNDLLVISIGEHRFSRREPDLALPSNLDSGDALRRIGGMLQQRQYIIEYYL